MTLLTPRRRSRDLVALEDDDAQDDVLAMLNRLLGEVHIPIPSGLTDITDLTPSLLLAITESLLGTHLLPRPHPRPPTRGWSLAAVTSVLRSLSSLLDEDLSRLDISALTDGDSQELCLLGQHLIHAAEKSGFLRPERYHSTPRHKQPPSPPATSISSFPTTARSSSRASLPSLSSHTSQYPTERSSSRASLPSLTSRTSYTSLGTVRQAPTVTSRSFQARSVSAPLQTAVPWSASSNRTATTEHTQQSTSSWGGPPSPTPIRSRSATPSATFEQVRALSRQGRRSTTPEWARAVAGGTRATPPLQEEDERSDEDDDGDQGGERYLSVVDDVTEWERTRSNLTQSAHTSTISADLDASTQLIEDRPASALSAQRHYQLLQQKAELLRQLADLKLQARGLGLDMFYEVVERGDVSRQELLQESL